jgi:hypothetical protein
MLLAPPTQSNTVNREYARIDQRRIGLFENPEQRQTRLQNHCPYSGGRRVRIYFPPPESLAIAGRRSNAATEGRIAVRLSGECVRCRRPEPHRPRLLGKPSFRVSPRCGCAQTAPGESRASAAARGRLEVRAPRDGLAPSARFPARAVSAPMGRLTTGPKLIVR